jgi:hypothetical protein
MVYASPSGEPKSQSKPGRDSASSPAGAESWPFQLDGAGDRVHDRVRHLYCRCGHCRGTNSPALLPGRVGGDGHPHHDWRAQLRRAGGHDAQGRRTVRLPARVAGAAVGISLRLDALPGHPDGHHRRRVRGLRQVSRRVFPRRSRRLTGFGTSPMFPRCGWGPWCWATWRSASARPT